MASSETDAEIVARSLEDPERFATIFDRHFDELHRYFERRIGRDDAGAFAGEVFRIAFERRDRYRLERTDCRPWLYGIASNLLRRHRRSQSRAVRALDRLRVRTSTSSAFPDVTDRLAAQAIWPEVTRAMAALRPVEREILLLAVWEELSYEEIAEALAIPVGTVRSRLSRIRQKLREQLRGIGEEPIDDAEPRPRRQRP